MEESAFRVEQLDDLQVVELLQLASPLAEFNRLSSMSSENLVQVARARLDETGLDVSAVAQLPGVNGLTTKRWFEAADPLNEQARKRLAGLCLLLSFKNDPTFVPEATDLVNEALACLRPTDPRATARHGIEKGAVVRSIFGPAGLMAVALYLCMESGEAGAAHENEA